MKLKYFIEAKNILMFHYYNFNYRIKNLVNINNHVRKYVTITDIKNNINLKKKYKNSILKLIDEV